LSGSFGPTPTRRDRCAFTFRLEHTDGTPADPPVLKTAVPNWSAGDTIPRGSAKPTLEVVDTRFDVTEAESVLVVKEA
jgi:hypothetical protein